MVGVSSDASPRDPIETVTLDLVVPVYNEIECLDELIRRLAELRTSTDETGIRLRAILVDDGSTDGSELRVNEIAEREDWVIALRLARNFGHQAAVTAGIDASAADYVAVIDADLQDPPELLPAMLHQLRTEELHVVYGTRSNRPGDSWFKKATANGFYRGLRSASGLDVPIDTGDFRVMDRSVVEALRRLPEHHRMMRALIPWLGYRSGGFTYTRDERFAGQTKYPLRKMIVLASHAVFSFSTFPVRLVQSLGLLLSALGGLGLLACGLLEILDGGIVGLGAWLLAGMVVQSGVLLVAIGLVGGYVFRIQDEVKGRPLYVLDHGSIGDRRPMTQRVERADSDH